VGGAHRGQDLGHSLAVEATTHTANTQSAITITAIARTITEALDHVLEQDPARPALIGASGTLSYEEFDGAANAAAAALRELGVTPGARVSASLPNDLDIATAFHGTMRLGAIWVGVNRNLAAPEKEVLLAAATPTIFLADPETAADHQAHWRVVPSAEWGSAVRAAAGTPRPPAPDPEAPAGIAFTSGTTGEPKGIVHSQRNLLLPAAAIVASRGYDETLRKGDCLPLTILNMQVLTTLLTSAAGGCCILTDRRDARGVAEWLARHQVNVWNGVPALLYSMVHDPEIDPPLLSSLREVWTGGAACPEDLYAAFESRFGVRLRQSYGLTEAPTVVTMEPVDGEHAEGSSGVLLPHLEVVTRDDEGRDLPAGEMGEIVVRGSRVGPWAGVYTPMTGFWRHGRVEPYRSTELPTGDIGTLDQAGNLFVRDRKKLLILRGGANVYPTEVERELERVPGVRASAVVGLPDERLGQRVAAVVEVDPDSSLSADDLIEHCRNRLARYKVPEQIRIVSALPRNAMGKVQRAPLADLFTPRA
jgi:acyl-CoA synthetase (AMP-forming)/AMP-acid ligase II